MAGKCVCQYVPTLAAVIVGFHVNLKHVNTRVFLILKKQHQLSLTVSRFHDVWLYCKYKSLQQNGLCRGSCLCTEPSCFKSVDFLGVVESCLSKLCMIFLYIRSCLCDVWRAVVPVNTFSLVSYLHKPEVSSEACSLSWHSFKRFTGRPTETSDSWTRKILWYFLAPLFL